jgi:hypothetical protein
MTFHSGDRVRLSVESNLDGFLYVIEEGSTGAWDVLFRSGPHRTWRRGRSHSRVDRSAPNGRERRGLLPHRPRVLGQGRVESLHRVRGQSARAQVVERTPTRQVELYSDAREHFRSFVELAKVGNPRRAREYCQRGLRYQPGSRRIKTRTELPPADRRHHAEAEVRRS